MPIRPENKARYPENWKQISEYIRFVRAGNCCEWCGAENRKPHPVTGSAVVLTCAHLDHVPENVAHWNLRALCQRCHLRFDAPVKRKLRAARKQALTDDLFAEIGS